MNKKKMLVWSLVGLVLILTVFRIATHRGKSKATDDASVAVKVMQPKVGGIDDTLDLSGSITAKAEANAYSKVPGKIVRFDKAEGDWVAKDETLAWVERDEIGLTYSLSPVKSPLAGQVAQKLVEIGETVTPGVSPVASVVNPGDLEVVVNIIEKELGRVARGQEARVQVEAFPQLVFKGRVARIAPVVDRLSKTTRVVIALETSGGKLKSGMFADVQILVGHKSQALLLPQEAVLKQDQQHYVYLAVGGKAQQRKVEPGWSQGGELEVAQGVAATDDVVVQGQTRLTEGTPLAVIKGE
ncbi:MAG: efflux RND transporter periplasmic adaptor subunit [Candidatus Firestonebacteria bacterium]|nr:efflux RND transporter periplasmic adaptor subunit [Candidatus Firestonebacteria bacterium]